MISEYIRYTIPTEQISQLEPAYKRAATWLDKSPHCLGYELSRCTEDQSKWILHIHWDSHDGHLQGFRKSEEFKHFYQEIAPFIPYIDEMRHYDLSSVVKSKQR